MFGGNPFNAYYGFPPPPQPPRKKRKNKLDRWELWQEFQEFHRLKKEEEEAKKKSGDKKKEEDGVKMSPLQTAILLTMMFPLVASGYTFLLSMAFTKSIEMLHTVIK